MRYMAYEGTHLGSLSLSHRVASVMVLCPSLCMREAVARVNSCPTGSLSLDGLYIGMLMAVIFLVDYGVLSYICLTLDTQVWCTCGPVPISSATSPCVGIGSTRKDLPQKVA